MSANKLLENASRDELLEEIRLLGIAFNEEFSAKKTAQKQVYLLQSVIFDVCKMMGWDNDQCDSDEVNACILALEQTGFEKPDFEDEKRRLFAKSEWEPLDADEIKILHY